MTDKDDQREIEEPQAEVDVTNNADQAEPMKAGARIRRLVPFAGIGILGGLVLGGAISAFIGGESKVVANTSDLIKPEVGHMADAIDALGDGADFKVLSKGDGTIDVVFTGAPECPHCQQFVKEGFDAFVREAQARNLDVVYMPLAMSPIGHSLAALDACITGEDVPSGAERIKQIYAQEAVLSQQADELSKLPMEGRREAMLETITQTAVDLGSKEDTLDFECYVGSAEAFRAESTLFAQVFEVKFTPSFFFEDPETGLTGFSGHRDIEWMFGRLAAE